MNDEKKFYIFYDSQGNKYSYNDKQGIVTDNHFNECFVIENSFPDKLQIQKEHSLFTIYSHEYLSKIRRRIEDRLRKNIPDLLKIADYMKEI